MSVELTISHLSKKFGKEVAVEDLNFTVQRGELFAFLGPSGAGKTTTLNLVAGLEKPDDGEILVDGESILPIKPAQRDFSMVFESYALYPHYTVAENMAFPLKAPGRSARYTPEQIRQAVVEAAKVLEIEELLDRFPKQLSGGQKQRVGLGRALVRRPRMFLMDEPIAHLDAKLRHHMRGELRKLQEKLGITTLLATPDYNEVVAMADRAAILNRGHIEQIGTPIELFTRPRNVVVARAIGDPPINLLECRVEQKDGSVLMHGRGFDVTCDQRMCGKIAMAKDAAGVILGVRPNEMTIEPAGKGLFDTEVYVFEPLGTEAVATLNLDGLHLKVVCPWERKLKIGEKVAVGFNLNKVHLFERQTGEALEI